MDREFRRMKSKFLFYCKCTDKPWIIDNENCKIIISLMFKCLCWVLDKIIRNQLLGMCKYIYFTFVWVKQSDGGKNNAINAMKSFFLIVTL